MGGWRVGCQIPPYPNLRVRELTVSAKTLTACAGDVCTWSVCVDTGWSCVKMARTRSAYCKVVLLGAAVCVFIITNNLYVSQLGPISPAKLTAKLGRHDTLISAHDKQHESNTNLTDMRQHERQAVVSQFCSIHKTAHQVNVTASLLVSDKYHALWCDIPKVACTTLKWKIANLSGQAVPTDPSIHTKEVLQRFGLRWLSSYTAEQQQVRLHNYYKFIFVRHPLLRVISAYKQKYNKERFLEWEVNQELLKIRSPMLSLQQRELQFNEFVWLITQSAMRNNEHWMQYQDKCTPCNIKYDFIGNLETFSEDFSHVLSTVFNVSGQAEKKSPKYGQSHAMKFSLDTGHRSTDRLTVREQQLLYNHCQQDAQMFGYSLDGIITKDISTYSNRLRTYTENPEVLNLTIPKSTTLGHHMG